MREEKKRRNQECRNIPMQSNESGMKEEEDLEERDLEKEEAYELPVYIGIPFGPDGGPSVSIKKSRCVMPRIFKDKSRNTCSDAVSPRYHCFFCIWHNYFPVCHSLGGKK